MNYVQNSSTRVQKVYQDDSSYLPNEEQIEIESVLSSTKNDQIKNILRAVSVKWDEKSSPTRKRLTSVPPESIYSKTSEDLESEE